MNVRRLLLAALALSACSSSSSPEEQAKAEVTSFIKSALGNLVAQATQLQSQAPTPQSDGWVASRDQAAIDSMKTTWALTRTSYENIEGAIAVLFPDVDNTIDNRYQAFLANNGPDLDLFDDVNVTGNHAIERILWAPDITQEVIAYESQLAGYVAAAWPANLQQATEFHDKLCQKFIDDATLLDTQFSTAVVLDDAAAFRGVVGSTQEQEEKITLASTSEEESRYARHTLGDMRANLQGTQATFDAFKPWITSQKGSALVTSIQAQLDTINAAYTAIQGDSIPDVPADWNPTIPTDADLATPYGMLWQLLQTQSNPDMMGSAVFLMNEAADLMKIPELPQ